jgi:oligopeptide/dipeptide ABC transporter ATP-binding protein
VRQRERKRIVLADELPDPTNLPSGCPFHTRCAYVMDVGREQMPAMTPVDGGGGGEVACHLQTTGPTLAGASIRELPVL